MPAYAGMTILERPRLKREGVTQQTSLSRRRPETPVGNKNRCPTANRKGYRSRLVKTGVAHVRSVSPSLDPGDADHTLRSQSPFPRPGNRGPPRRSRFGGRMPRHPAGTACDTASYSSATPIASAFLKPPSRTRDAGAHVGGVTLCDSRRNQARVGGLRRSNPTAGLRSESPRKHRSRAATCLVDQAPQAAGRAPSRHGPPHI
jgi:hypothetical protein